MFALAFFALSLTRTPNWCITEKDNALWAGANMFGAIAAFVVFLSVWQRSSYSQFMYAEALACFAYIAASTAITDYKKRVIDELSVVSQLCITLSLLLNATSSLTPELLLTVAVLCVVGAVMRVFINGDYLAVVWLAVYSLFVNKGFVPFITFGLLLLALGSVEVIKSRKSKKASNYGVPVFITLPVVLSVDIAVKAFA